jgi:hypothetical protein
MRRSDLRPEFVEFIPERLKEGCLFISKRYRTASHLCCCGCGTEVVTPINPTKWHLTEHADGTVSLLPSIGNWSFPCKSHYFVSKNRIQWAAAFSPAQIAVVQSLDQYDAVMLDKLSRPPWAAFRDAVHRGLANFVSALRKAWRG